MPEQRCAMNLIDGPGEPDTGRLGRETVGNAGVFLGNDLQCAVCIALGIIHVLQFVRMKAQAADYILVADLA